MKPNTNQTDKKTKTNCGEKDKNLVEHKVPTVAEADANIAAIMKEYPQLSYGDAILLAVYRFTKDHSMMIANSSGGGKYSAFLRKHGIKH